MSNTPDQEINVEKDTRKPTLRLGGPRYFAFLFPVACVIWVECGALPWVSRLTICTKVSNNSQLNKDLL